MAFGNPWAQQNNAQAQGLLGGMGQGSGLLGGMFSGFDPSAFSQGMVDNQGALMGLAAGILGGQNMRQGLGQGLANFQQGRAYDTKRNSENQTQAAAVAYAQKNGFTPQQIEMVKASKEAQQAVLTKMFQAPKEADFGVIGEGGDGIKQYGWIDAPNRKVTPGPQLPNMGTGYRPATDQERAAYGVAQGVPLMIGPNGKPTSMGPQTVVNNVNGENTFDKTVGEGQGKMFLGMAQDGPAAQADLGRVGTLRQNLSKLPGGMLGGLQGMASSMGIKLGASAGNVEAANAIISQLVPAQRQGMPGAASDRDIQMFRDALPKLSNTPEGNAMILDTMQALAEQRQKQAEIASAVVTGQMTRQDGMKALQALPDPFAGMRQAVGGTQSTAVPKLQPGQKITHPSGVTIERLGE